MPQMMPLNWFILYNFFTMMLITFNVIFFYTFFNNPKMNFIFKMMPKNMFWKW